MTTIRLFNTKTRRKEVFEPIDPQNVRMYVCGPTVYDRAHLGNARPVVVFDVLFRLLRHVYGADHVTYVRNFTDVDDKINDAALARQQAGDPRPLEALIRERTEETIRWYHDDMDALGALRPTKEPRATEWIGAMIAMIEGLIAGGHAYEAAGHVLFRVRSYAAYGALSGRSVDDMIAGARVEVAPFKEDPLDFVLWKPSDATLPGWDSPWGRGRPGWHIECSAMAQELLGSTFDIHGGGLDLQFPHHENEIAQSACAHPEGGFARYWMHNEMLLVDGKKMSKSLGNFFTVSEIHKGRSELSYTLRYLLISSHYRSKANWTDARFQECRELLNRWGNALRAAEHFGVQDGEPSQKVVEALCKDLNTSEALAEMGRLALIANRVDPEAEEAARTFVATLPLLGFENMPSSIGFWWPSRHMDSQTNLILGHILAVRDVARKIRMYSLADQIRRELAAIGVHVNDQLNGRSLEFDDKLEEDHIRELSVRVFEIASAQSGSEWDEVKALLK